MPHYTGKLAEAEGHKLDALRYYQRAVARFDNSLDERTRMRALWDELGGSEEAFKAWMAQTSTQKSTPAKPGAGVHEPSTRPLIATDTLPWNEMNKSLSTLNAADLTGKFGLTQI